MTDYTSCWYNKSLLYSEMIRSVRNHQSFEQIGHGKVLISLVNMVDDDELKFLDVGTGGGLGHTIVKKSEWTGCDLSHVIENVSKKCFPDLNYIECDLLNDDLSFLKEFDILLFNAIFDVMENPIELLERVLKNSKNYVIIHRQQISNGYLSNGFTITKEPSYGGFTFRTNIERKLFINILKNNKFSIIKEMDSGLGLSNNYSFLLKKDE